MAPAAICQRTGICEFDNRTVLDSGRLQSMCLDAVAGWRLDGLDVRVRYSRSTDFSGTCYYRTRRIYVNLGRHLTYPYQMGTHLARARSNAQQWWKPIYTIELAGGAEVVLFVFLHECFHFLVKRARRNTRQKESMCDRFAARVLVDRYGATVRDEKGHPVPRSAWDFQDLDRFVAGARRKPGTRRRAPRAAPRAAAQSIGGQLLLFDL